MSKISNEVAEDVHKYDLQYAEAVKEWTIYRGLRDDDASKFKIMYEMGFKNFEENLSLL
jgi:hypothetical protein